MARYDVQRRRLLIALGTASGVGLAGCPSTDDGGSTPTTGTEETPTPTPTPAEETPTPTQTPAEGYGLEGYGQYGYGS